MLHYLYYELWMNLCRPAQPRLGWLVINPCLMDLSDKQLLVLTASQVFLEKLTGNNMSCYYQYSRYKVQYSLEIHCQQFGNEY